MHGGKVPFELIDRDSKTDHWKTSETDSESDDEELPRTELGYHALTISSILGDLFKLAFKIRNTTNRSQSSRSFP